MRIRKYDFNWGRRELLKKSAVGATAGLLMPLSEVLAKGKDLSKAYPDELLSVDEYTKGKVSVGDYITADNVHYVKDLLDPMIYKEIKDMGRKIRIKKTDTDPNHWFAWPFAEANRRNKKNGTVAALDKTGNVVVKGTGKHWVGGTVFPDPKNGLEAQYNLAMSWGRHDFDLYAIQERDINPDGSPAYDYDFVWAELQVSARTDGTVFHNENNLLRYQTVFFTNTQDVAGTSFESTWFYDQRKFPTLIGYLPQFRRTRTFPASQRFEPLIPGATWFLSDAWAAGDPVLTWGDYKIKGRKPMLGAFNVPWYGDDPKNNWWPPLSGGPHNSTWIEGEYELAPECMVLDSKPTHYPRAPVGYRRVWIDTRNQQFSGCIRYDRNGKLWNEFEGATGMYISPKGKTFNETGTDHPVWSWMYVQVYDIQQKRISHIAHTHKCFGGYTSSWGGNNNEAYEKWFTQQAIQRLGAV